MSNGARQLSALLRRDVHRTIPILLGALLLLVILGNAVAQFTSHRVLGLATSLVEENLSSMTAAAALETALLEQRGLVAWHILAGGRGDRLEELDQRRQAWSRWFSVAEENAHTPLEREVLAEVRAEYARYDSSRNRVIALYERGATDAARTSLLEETNPLASRVRLLCGRVQSINSRLAQTAVFDATRHRQEATTWVIVINLVALALGAILLWLFFREILFPLRRLARDAGVGTTVGPWSLGDELRVVGSTMAKMRLEVDEARQSLEQTRRRTLINEKLAAVGQLAACVAHEIRKPLTALKMWLHFIHKEVGDNPDLQAKCVTLEEEFARLDGIVNSFLEFSGNRPLRVEPRSVMDLIDETLELLTHRLNEKRIRVTRENHSFLPEVCVDGAQMKQVFLNLLSNAIEASEDGAEIRITPGIAQEIDGKPMVVIRIQDMGPGIPESVRGVLFQPFVTNKRTGTGLGLFIAQNIVERHGGRLELESSSGRGTTFAVWISTVAGARG